MRAHAEKLEGLSRRLGLPHVPEYELSYYRDLFAPELRADLAAQQDPASRGRLLRLLGDSAGAASELNRALDLDPSDARAHEWLGEAALGTPAGEASLDRAVELGAVWALLYRGAGRLERGDKDGAQEDLREFLKHQPDSALGRMLAGDCRKAAALDPACSAAWLLLARAETGEASLRATESALDADPDYAHTVLARWQPGTSWPLFLRRLRAFAFAGDRHLPVCIRFEKDELQFAPYHDDAVAKAEAILKAHPDRAWSLALLGRALSRLQGAGRQADAAALFDRALELAPHAGWLHAWRALARAKSGDDAGALDDLAECLRKQPYYYRAYAWRASLLRRLGRPREALADLDRAVPVDGLYPFLIHERSLARRAAGDMAGAALDLDRAFRLDQRYSWRYTTGRQPGPEETASGLRELDGAIAAQPGVVSLRVWKGELQLQSGAVPEAYQELSAAARLDPHHALAQAFLGLAQLRSGRPVEAAGRLRHALALEPGLWAAHGWLAQALAANGDTRGASSALTALLRRRPKAAWAWRQRAALKKAAGKARAALADARRALELEGRSADGWYLLAEIQEALGALGQAREAIERALSVSPNLGRAYVLRARIGTRQGRAAEAVCDYRTVLERFPYLFNEEQRRQVEALLS